VSALATLFAVQRAHAIVIVNSQPVEFGPLSLARGEVFRFYVSNPATGANAPDCDARVTAYDAAGNTFSVTDKSAGPGRTEFVDISFEAFTRRAGSSRVGVDSGAVNVPIRAVARLSRDTTPGIGPVDCVLTSEVYDSLTGRALKVNEAEERNQVGGGGRRGSQR